MPVLVWVGLVIAGLAFVSRLHVSADMAAFLPRAASPGQQVLVDQMRDGIVSRLVLVAIEAPRSPDRLAALSKGLAARLRENPAIATVSNGELQALGRDRDFLWSHRYVLSDQVSPARFTAAGLRQALEQDLTALGSTAGFLLKRTLAEDPTGEMLHLIEQQAMAGDGPARPEGVFVSPDGTRALLIVQLRAAGSDLDAEQAALAAIRAAFSETARGVPEARLILSGPPVFAVEARDRIRSDITRLSAAATLIVASGLLLAYRSPLVLLLAFVPVTTGLLAGVVAVGGVFGTVQGVTLGFGTTLIGEAVDYAIYLFTQTTADSPPARTMARIWPTLRLGTATSICGFSAMLLSGFEGFAQLGLLTIAGVAVAACVTRWVLPALLPRGFAGVRQSRPLLRAAAVAGRTRPLRLPAALLIAASLVSLAFGRGAFWAGDLASLSPVPAAQLRLDQTLRRDMRAPEAAFLVASAPRPTMDAALESAERLDAVLKRGMAQGWMAGFETPSRVWPSAETQRARLAALPPAPALRQALDTALKGLPFQPGLFEPFLAAVERARDAGPITRHDLDGTSLALQLDSLLMHGPDGWMALLPLRGVTDPSRLAEAIQTEPGAMLIDLKAESNAVLGAYLREGASLAGLGAAGIVLLLLAALRSWRRLARVTLPLAASVVVTLAGLRLAGHPLSVFNLFGLLLVVAIGSNYCLFFERQPADRASRLRVVASVLFANASTVAGFGVLALSATPVLHDLGLPVACGTLLSLLFAAILTSPSRSHAA